MNQENKPKTYKVAVLKGARYEDDYGNTKWVSESISEWYEVSEEDYKALQLYCNKYDFRLIEPVPVMDVLADARKVYVYELERIRKYEAEQKKAREKRAAAKQKKEAELVAEMERNKKQMLKKLAEETGFDLVPKT